MQKYPIGIQTFSEIRERGFLYVDKTDYVERLINGSKYYFLARPRRFGKSVLLSTLKSVFQGRRDLFKGLFIENKIEWGNYPIIHLSFANMDYQNLGLEAAISYRLDLIAQENNCNLTSQGMSFRFDELIRTLHTQTGRPVVILIDEYDTPIVHYLGTSIQKALENRDILRSFYAVIKDSDAHIRFFFLTGISRFSKMSIFPALNNLDDISMDAAFGGVCGYTQPELLHYFLPRIQEIAQEMTMTQEACIQQITDWYNGFCFTNTAKPTVYSPFSTLLFMQKAHFSNYWFSTGTPSFLVKMLNKEYDYDLDDIVLHQNILENFNLEHLNHHTLLFQTGYLAIKEPLGNSTYRVGYPNHEVRESMLAFILNEYFENPQIDSQILAYDLRILLNQGNPQGVMKRINTLFAQLPFELYAKNYENFYHAIIFTMFKLLGCTMECEVSHAEGRIDAVAKTPQYIYIFEFKFNKSAQKALKQIKDNKYAEPYMGLGKKIFLIGANFTDKTRGVQKFLIEEIHENI
jgi:hypothetical protein